MSSSLIFKKATVGPFMGINPDKPIVIEFPPVRKNSLKRPMGKISGDQGIGKSSFATFLLHAAGQKLGFKLNNLVNNEKGEMKGEQEFESEGETWKVRFSKSKFELFRLFKPKAGKQTAWIPMADPATMVKKLIGVVGVSPMKLRDDKGENQVDWLFKLLNVPQDVLDRDKEIRDNITAASKVHSEANKKYIFLKTELAGNPMYLNYEHSEKKYKDTKTVETLKAKMETANQQKVKLSEAKERLASHRRNITEKEKDIEDLQAKLKKAQQELGNLVKLKDLAVDYVEKNASADEQYEAVHNEFVTISVYLAEKAQWEALKAKKIEMDEFETVMQKAAAVKDTLKAKKRNNLKVILPDIPGLEVVTEDEIDGQQMGVYLDGRNPIQLSESELFDLYFKICRFLKVRMVVIENISSFGSDVIRTLNALSNAGVYVWYTEMKRGQEDLKIEFVDSLN